MGPGTQGSRKWVTRDGRPWALGPGPGWETTTTTPSPTGSTTVWRRGASNSAQSTAAYPPSRGVNIIINNILKN